MSTKIDGLDLHNALSELGWVWWSYTANRSKTLDLRSPAGRLVDTQVLEVHEEEMPEYGLQGEVGEAFIIFKVTYDGETDFFKKTGTVSSYGETEWSGKFARVTPREKKVTVYEFD